MFSVEVVRWADGISNLAFGAVVVRVIANSPLSICPNLVQTAYSVVLLAAPNSSSAFDVTGRLSDTS